MLRRIKPRTKGATSGCTHEPFRHDKDQEMGPGEPPKGRNVPVKLPSVASMHHTCHEKDHRSQHQKAVRNQTTTPASPFPPSGPVTLGNCRSCEEALRGTVSRKKQGGVAPILIEGTQMQGVEKAGTILVNEGKVLCQRMYQLRGANLGFSAALPTISKDRG